MKHIERTYRISELSEMTGIPVSTLQHYVMKGALTAARTGLGNKHGEYKRGIRIAESDFLAWWNERKAEQALISGVEPNHDELMQRPRKQRS